MKFQILSVLSWGLTFSALAGDYVDLPKTIFIDKIPVSFTGQLDHEHFSCLTEQLENLKAALGDSRVLEAKKSIDGFTIIYNDFPSAVTSKWTDVATETKLYLKINTAPHWFGVKPAWIHSKAPCDIVQSNDLVKEILEGANKQSKELAQKEKDRHELQRQYEQISKMGDASDGQQQPSGH